MTPVTRVNKIQSSVRKKRKRGSRQEKETEEKETDVTRKTVD